ncbi:MAG: hypothetical protein AAF663_04385 [Planctomycetota bacterium]
MSEGLSLMGWTDTESPRYALDRPWRHTDGRAIATDGRGLIVLNDGSGYVLPQGPVPKLKGSGILKLIDSTTPREWSKCPDVEGPPEGADSWWDVHPSRCPTCKAIVKGKVWESSRNAIEFCGEMFDRRYVWMVSQLPGAKVGVAVCGKVPVLLFRFEGGGGLVASMDKDKF